MDLAIKVARFRQVFRRTQQHSRGRHDRSHASCPEFSTPMADRRFRSYRVRPYRRAGRSPAGAGLLPLDRGDDAVPARTAFEGMPQSASFRHEVAGKGFLIGGLRVLAVHGGRL